MKNVLFSILGKMFVYLVAGTLGVALGGGFFYVVFFAPSWFMGEDILLIWGWFGTPLGFVGGVAIFLTVLKRLGRYLALRLKPHVQSLPYASFFAIASASGIATIAINFQSILWENLFIVLTVTLWTLFIVLTFFWSGIYWWILSASWYFLSF